MCAHCIRLVAKSYISLRFIRNLGVSQNKGISVVTANRSRVIRSL